MAAEKSVAWVIVALMLAIAAVGWGFLAGSYTGAHTKGITDLSDDELADLQGTNARRLRSVANASFVGNAIKQLPNFATVVSWHITNRIWLPIIFIVLEACVFFGGFKMRKLERKLSEPYRPKR